MLTEIILRVRIKLALQVLATAIFFGVLAWISARFLGEDSFPTFLFTVMAVLMIVGLTLVVFVAPFVDRSRPSP